MNIKSHLDHIWNHAPLAFRCHLAGWLDVLPVSKYGEIYGRVSNSARLTSVKGKKLNPLRRRYKIFK